MCFSHVHGHEVMRPIDVLDKSKPKSAHSPILLLMAMRKTETLKQRQLGVEFIC